MFALERQKIILELLAQNGRVWVSELSKTLGVTEETVRRDLEKLEQQEVLMRIHGGAMPIDETSYDLSLEKRKRTNVDIKEKLAKKAAEFIQPGDTVFLDASTTTFYLSKEIKNMQNITVVTNSLRIVNELEGVDKIKLIAIGGLVSKNLSFVGSLAEKSLEGNYFATKMFLSSKGISIETGILEGNEQECAIKQKMIENCKSVYFLCDKSKIGRVGFVKLAPLSCLDYFITDGGLDSDWHEKLKELNIELINITEGK